MAEGKGWEDFQDIVHVGTREVRVDGKGHGDILKSSTRKIAVIGTRKPSKYGRDLCREWGEELARRGFGLVTGAALGIDSIATRAFLRLEAPIVEVLPAPLNLASRLPGKPMLNEVLRGNGLAAVISQFPLSDRQIEKWMFVKRNETIAALAEAVVVIEAQGASGTFHTVRAANNFGIPAFAVPGRVTDASSLGCNILIKNGDAKPALSIEDVIEAANNYNKEYRSRERWLKTTKNL